MWWSFYLNPKDAWDAMLADCEHARSSIDFEQYIFVPDDIGKRFLEVFRRKAREGVRVRLLFDSVGSFGLHNSSYHASLTQEGIAVEFFNPIQPWRLANISSWFFRDHRKLAVIDACIGHVGGVCIDVRMRDWRDTNVRVCGEVVAEMQYAFGRMWETVREKRFLRFGHGVFDGSERFLVNSAHFRQRFVYYALLDAVRSAKRYIYLTSPYFVPSIRLFRALRKQAKKGIDVRLIVPKHSDVQVVDLATTSYFSLAMKSGIKIFLYDKAVLHAKTAVIDGAWGTVGSANLDNLSLLLSYEGNLISSDRAFIAELEGQFVVDMEASQRVLPNAWHSRSWRRKALEALTWPIHEFL